MTQANEEMSHRVLQKYGDICDPAMINRIRKHGAEMHDDLLITDRKYFYTDEDMFVQRLYETGRRDWDWFLSWRTTLSTVEKIAQVVTISKWSGHGTSLGDLKEAKGLHRKTLCSDKLLNEL